MKRENKRKEGIFEDEDRRRELSENELTRREELAETNLYESRERTRMRLRLGKQMEGGLVERVEVPSTPFCKCGWMEFQGKHIIGRESMCRYHDPLANQ